MFLHTILNLNIYYSVVSVKWFSGYYWYQAQIPFSDPAHSPPVAMRMAPEGSQLPLSFLSIATSPRRLCCPLGQLRGNDFELWVGSAPLKHKLISCNCYFLTSGLDMIVSIGYICGIIPTIIFKLILISTNFFLYMIQSSHHCHENWNFQGKPQGGGNS